MLLLSVHVNVLPVKLQAHSALAVPDTTVFPYVKFAGIVCVVVTGFAADGLNVAVAVSTCVSVTVPPGATLVGLAVFVIVNCAVAGAA